MNHKRHFYVFLRCISFFLFLSFIVLLLSSVFYYFTEFENPTSSDAAFSGTVLPPQVILDPGHGGRDSGAVSLLGTEEKHLNLIIAKKIGAFLKEAGIRVIYTRTTDEMLYTEGSSTKKNGDLMARVRIAKENPSATFISIHMNTLPIEKYNGLQVFYSNDNTPGRALAQVMQNEVIRLLQPDNHRKAKSADGNIFVLDRIGGDSILIECGFLSTAQEAKLLIDETYQNKLAYVLSRTILQYILQKNEM